MKKIFLAVFLLMGFHCVQAQEELDDINKLITLKQYARAKVDLDKFMADSKNASNAAAQYYKAFICNAMSLDKTTAASTATQLNKDAYAAIKKYHELDPKGKLTKEEENSTIYNVYYSFYDLAVKAYNAKDFEQSYNQFTNVLDVHDYIFSNNIAGVKGVKFVSLDTDVVYNMIILGNEIKKTPEDLLPFYKKIINAGLSESKYLEAYEGTVMIYRKAKDAAAFNEYLAKGRAKFPTDEFWEAIDIEFNTDGLTNEALFKKYEELLAKYPKSYVLLFNYGFELNKYVFSDEPKTGDVAAMKTKIPELFRKAIAVKSTVEANMLTANYYYNSSFDLQEESKKVKGTKPDDVKKRTELMNSSKAVMNECIPFAEETVKLYAAMTKMKGSDKINYKQAYEMLITAYKMNGNAAKAAEAEKKKAEIL